MDEILKWLWYPQVLFSVCSSEKFRSFCWKVFLVNGTFIIFEQKCLFGLFERTYSWTNMILPKLGNVKSISTLCDAIVYGGFSGFLIGFYGLQPERSFVWCLI